MKLKKKGAQPQSRWWNNRSLEKSEPAAFQRYSFDDDLGTRRSDAERLSPQAMNFCYGNKSIGWHVEKLIRRVHEAVAAKLPEL